jgi:hypothetical protein
MTDSPWRGEIRAQAMRWPFRFRAHLERGVWSLLGADEDVYQEFDSCAQRLAHELHFPPGDCRPKEALLYRLKECGRHVRLSEKVRTHRFGSVKVGSKVSAASVSPLREALIGYLDHEGSGTTDCTPKSQARAQNTWQVVAAEHNRERRSRLCIIKALQKLGIPPEEWPDCVRGYSTSPGEHSLDSSSEDWKKELAKTEYHQTSQPPPFEPPEFDRLNQSRAEWVKVADAAWELHRNRFLQRREFWVKAGVDDEIGEEKHTRGPGSRSREHKRDNSALDLRFEWAALRLCGIGCKEISARYNLKESQVTKQSKELLVAAGWSPKAKP